MEHKHDITSHVFWKYHFYFHQVQKFLLEFQKLRNVNNQISGQRKHFCIVKTLQWDSNVLTVTSTGLFGSITKSEAFWSDVQSLNSIFKEKTYFSEKWYNSFAKFLLSVTFFLSRFSLYFLLSFCKVYFKSFLLNEA